MIEQEPLDEAANSIDALVAVDALDGFAANEIHRHPLELLVHWHGPVPPRLAELLSRLSCSVVIVVVPADYSLKQIDAEERLIVGLTRAQVGGSITQVGPLNDYSGISVKIDPRTTGKLTLPQLQARMDKLGTPMKKTVSFGYPVVPI